MLPTYGTLFPPETPVAAAPTFKVNEPDWEKARVCALQAVKKAEAGDFKGAIRDIEAAMKLDSVGALTSFGVLRDEFYASIGKDFPRKASEMYNYAIELKRKGRYRDASLAYQEAAALDPLFLWPLNNLAWMLSTSKDRSVCNGAEAVRFAMQACEKSNWNCWAFVGTLAAAYAAAGDFAKAIGWQQATLRLVPKAHRLDAELRLRHYQLGQAYVDEGTPAVGARSEDDKHISRSELVFPENISPRSLRDLFRAAYYEAELDEEGQLWIANRFNVFVYPSESGGHVTLSVFQKPNSVASDDACLQFVNRINSSIRLLRAAYHESEGRRMLVFDWEIPIQGGITKKAVILALRFFLDLVSSSITKLDVDGVFGGNR